MSLARIICRRCLDAHISAKVAQSLVPQKRLILGSPSQPVTCQSLLEAQPRAKHNRVDPSCNRSRHAAPQRSIENHDQPSWVGSYSIVNLPSCSRAHQSYGSSSQHPKLPEVQLQDLDPVQLSDGTQFRWNAKHSLDIQSEASRNSKTRFQRKSGRFPAQHTIQGINNRIDSASRFTSLVAHSRHLHTATQAMPRRRTTESHIQPILKSEMIISSSKTSGTSRPRGSPSTSSSRSRRVRKSSLTPKYPRVIGIQLQGPLQDKAYIESCYNPDNSIKLKSHWRENPKSTLSNYVREKTGKAPIYHFVHGAIGSEMYYR